MKYLPTLCFSLLAGAALLSADESKPNILVLFADDLGYADIGANGIREDIATPHIDAIAKNGVRFTDGYATHPICSPSRAGLMSGMYQHRFGFENNSGPEAYAARNFGQPRSIPTLAEKLKSAGYATGMVGKWHIGFQEGLRPWERGFDFFYGFLSGARSYLPDGRYGGDPVWRNGEKLADEFDYLTDAFADEAVEFIKQSLETKNQERKTKNTAKPFFLYLAFNAVHDPMEATEKYEARFPDIGDPRRRTLAAMLAAMDDAIGRVMTTVRERGEEESTLVFFYSDNGGIPPKNASLNDPLRGMKGQMFEGGIRVPFLAQWKGTLPAGQVFEHPVMGFDVHATALAAAGLTLEAEPEIDGVDLVPFLTGKAEGRPHEALFWRAARQHAARAGDWKLLTTPRDGTFLFDLANDTGETNNLAETHPEKLAELQRIYAAWDAQMMDPLWIRQDHRNAEPGGKLKTASQTPAKPRPAARPSSAPDRIREAFERADENGDGKLSREELPKPDDFDRIDADGDGFVTLEEVSAFYGRRDRPASAPSDDPAPTANRPAGETGAFFRRTEIPGLTDVEAGTNGFALVDLNRDGWIDYLATQTTPGIHLPKGPKGNPIPQGDRLRVLLNREGKGFEEAEIEIESEWLSPAEFGRGSQIPNLVDLNGDGFLDLLVGRSSPVNAGKVRPGADTPGNTLLLSDGAWNRFREIPGALGASNEVAYNRQSAFADIDGNGWLDLAIGCDNIGDTMGGFPHSRLYLFEPGENGLLSGRFEDIGGTDRVPDFGGWHDDDDKDKAGPDIQFADLDNDGDLDLIQACHVDIRDPLSEFSPAEYRQGVWCWKNLLKETGEARFEKITGNGLAVEGRLRWSEEKKQLVPESPAPGLPYVALADVDNDGLLDILAIGPSDPGWAPRAEDVGGRFWRNLGDFQFEEATVAAGLESLNWTHRQWYAFHGMEVPEHLANWTPRYGPNYENQPGRKKLSPMDERPYWADIVFGDFDNDGWVDFVAMDRRDGTTRREGRSVLYHNRGDGTFEPLPQAVSGIDAKGISGEAADLNNDGRLDLVFAADPDNSGGWRRTDAPERYRDKVFLGTEAKGGGNHWLRLRFAGVSHHELAGARVTATTGDRTQVRTVFSAHAYKSGGPMEAHFGLGDADAADLTVQLLDGRTFEFPGFAADRIAELTLGENAAESAATAEADEAEADESTAREALGLPRFLRRFDRDRDGFLTKKEMPPAGDFEAMDGNGDGRVTGTEAFTWWTNRQAMNAPRVAGKSAEEREKDGTFERLAEAPEGASTVHPWPQFLGPKRDGVAAEGPKLSRSWPEGGPPVTWRAEVSGGFGGVAVDQGRVFLLDRPATDEEAVRCFHFETGEELWRYTYPTRNVRLPYSGSRTVPSVEGDLVWTLGVVGELRCLDWKKGELRWRVDLIEEAELEIPPRWGVSQSPLRHGGLVIVPAINDERGFLFAFDERTGELKWRTSDLGGANYVTPTLHTIGGVEQLLMFGKTGVGEGAWHGIDPASGEVLWTWTGYDNPAQITHPVALGDDRFWITGGYDVGSRIVRIARDGGGGWKVEDLGGHGSAGSQVHTPLLFEGHLFANLNTNETLRRSRRAEAGLGCFDLEGNLLWNTGEDPHFDRGGLLIADGLLVALDGETGELVLIEPSPEAYRELGRTTLFKDRAKQSWAPLAIADGRLFARSQTELACVDLRDAEAADSAESTARTLVPVLGEDLRAWLTKLDTDRSRSIDPGEVDDPREIRGADRNADGVVSYREASRYFGDMQATLAARANPDIYFPWKKTEGQKPLRTAESGDPLLNLTFTRSLPNGERDANGHLLTGTEVMHLETHGGMLFATLSGWNHDTKRLPWPGASVAVKKAANAEWEREHNFGEQTGRAGSLASIAFTTDADGRKLEEPVSVLLAGVGGREDEGVITVWARDDDTGTWIKTIAGRHDGPGSPEVRVISGHLDSVTGVHHVFAAASNGMLFRGAYDPEAPGRIRWAVQKPEISGRERRLMAMAEWQGSLYLTVDLEPTEPDNGGLFRRIDGPEPKWERVSGWKWSTPKPDTPRPWFGLRGLTNVHGVLLGAREQPGTMDRIDPEAEGEKVIVDYDVRSGLLDTWPFTPESGGPMTIIAYNDMVPARHPATDESIALIPLGTRHPQGGRMYGGGTNELGASAWYLVRHGEGDYGIGQISDSAHPIPNPSSGGLRATRTIRPSPFPEEKGRVWYFGGFDAFGGPSHLHTGWVYRGELPKS